MDLLSPAANNRMRRKDETENPRSYKEACRENNVKIIFLPMDVDELLTLPRLSYFILGTIILPSSLYISSIDTIHLHLRIFTERCIYLIPTYLPCSSQSHQ